jgi:hypothetical protein
MNKNKLTNAINFSNSLAISLANNLAISLANSISISFSDSFSLLKVSLLCLLGFTIITTTAMSAHAAGGTTTTGDLPVVQFAVASQSVDESAGFVNVTLTLSAASGSRITVPYTTEGTAEIRNDIRGINSAFVFRAGMTTLTKKFTLTIDTIAEVTETFKFKLGTPNGATLGTVTEHTLTITDSAPVVTTPPVAQWSTGFQTITENIGLVMISARLDKVSTSSITIPYTVAGTASKGVDHDLADGTLTIPAGSTSLDKTFQIIDDSIYDDSETINVSMGTPTNATLGIDSVHIVTIKDNELAPVVNFQSATQSISEAGGSLAMVLTLDKVSSKPVTVIVASSGSAIRTTDYTLAQTTITIPAGSLSQTLQIPIVDDTLFEAAETLILTLQAPTGATLGSSLVHTATITDNDTAPLVQFQSLSQSVYEDQGTVTLNVTLNKASGLATTVPFTVSGTAQNPSDHNLAPASVMVPAGQTQAAISFQVVNDAIAEGSETVVLTLGTPTNGSLSGVNGTHSVTIADLPTVQFAQASQSLDENISPGLAAVTLSAPSTRSVTVSFMVSGNANNSALGRVKYNLANGTVTFAPGQTSQNIQIPLVNDTTPGPSDLYISLSLTSPVSARLGTITNDILTIIDNDAALAVGEEAFRTSAWPLTRQRCIACHNSSTSIPNHASDSLATGYAAAKALTNFSDIANSRMVLKTADGHCGSACVVTGSSTDTKPLMIAAITTWAKAETAPIPSATPTPTPTITPVSSPGAIAILDGTQYLEHITGSLGLSSATYKSTLPFSDLIYRLSANEDTTMVDAPMLLAYVALSGKICVDLVNKEAATTVNSTSRIIFGPIDFATNTSVLTTVLTRANLDTVVNNLSKQLLLRLATQEEKDAIASMVTTATTGRTLTVNDTRQLMVMTCTSIASSVQNLQH